MATNTQTVQPLTTIISDITFADTGTVEIGSIPPGAILVDLKVFVGTVYDSVTSDSLSVGHGAYGNTAADVDEFETAINLQSAGNASLTILQLGQVISATDNVPITVSTTSVGGSLSAGAATVLFTYAQK